MVLRGMIFFLRLYHATHLLQRGYGLCFRRRLHLIHIEFVPVEDTGAKATSGHKHLEATE